MVTARNSLALQSVLYNLDLPLPDGRKLFAHQKEAIYTCWKEGSVVLAHNVGLGKTATALVAAAGWGCRIICIVKPSLIENWRREAALLGLTVDIFSWAKMPISGGPWQPYVLICDESALYCNLKSQRSQAMLNLAFQAEAVIHCTGTPMPNGQPRNLYPLLLSIGHPVAVNKLKEYEMRYCAARLQRFTNRDGRKIRFWDTSGGSHLDELHELIKDRVLYKHKRDCLDLPPLIRVMRDVELSRDMQDIYDITFNKAKLRYLERVANKEISSEGAHLPEMVMLRRAASIAKTETAVEVAQEILGQGSRVVIFTGFPESAEMIARDLGCECLTGKVSQPRRQAMVDRLARGQSSALVATIGTGGEGLNGMQAADYCILVDRDWVPATTTQAEGRIERIGQTQNMTSIWLRLGELDEAIDALVTAKQVRIDMVLKGKRRSMRGLTTTGEAERHVARALFEE